METESVDFDVNDDVPSDFEFDDRWEDIGYHRILGGFLWNLIFAIFGIGYSLLLPIIIPYPESLGFYNILTGIFSSIFTFADLGLASALSRYIAEYRVKDKHRTLQYIRFFIWFQAITGLIQTTAVSLMGLKFLGGTNLSFMPWMFVWLSIVQYPGWLGVFTEALKGFQQYGKVTLAGVLNGLLFQTITLVIGAQLGAMWGRANPEFGPVMGTSIGLILGYYVDDFTTTLITGYMFSKVMAPMGIRLRDVLIPDFSKEIAVESIKFGLGVMVFTITYQVVGTILSLIYAGQLPNYSTFVGVLALLGPFIGLAEQINGMHIGNHRATVSEAYFNDKPHYAVYILSNGFRTMGEISMMIIPLTLLLAPLVVEELYPDYLGVFYQIFALKLVFSSIFQHSHLMNEVLIGTGHHKFNILITIAEQITTLIASLIFIKLELGIYVLLLPGFFQTAIKQGFGWWFINTRIIDLKINVWQNWIAPAMAGALYFLLFFGLNTLFGLILTPYITKFGSLAVLIILGIYVFPGPFYFLPLAFFGGYDDNTLTDLKKGAQLAGPSKPIAVLWYKGAAFGAKISPLHNRFPMAYEKVGEEIRELTKMKKNVDSMKEK